MLGMLQQKKRTESWGAEWVRRGLLFISRYTSHTARSYSVILCTFQSHVNAEGPVSMHIAVLAASSSTVWCGCGCGCAVPVDGATAGVH